MTKRNRRQGVQCTLGCLINNGVGGDHAYCECPCHITLPAVPPSRKRISVPHGPQIKEMLQIMRMTLINETNQFDADYHVSARGVPYVNVNLFDKRYTFTYFGRTMKFKVFFPDQSKVDLRECEEVIYFFRSLRSQGE